MGCTSWWTHQAVSSSSQYSTTGVTKVMVCDILSVGVVHIKEPLLLIGKSSLCDWSRFPLLLSGPLSYVRYHITVNKNVLSALLNKTFPSSFPCVWYIVTQVYKCKKIVSLILPTS